MPPGQVARRQDREAQAQADWENPWPDDGGANRTNQEQNFADAAFDPEPGSVAGGAGRQVGEGGVDILGGWQAEQQPVAVVEDAV